MDDALDFDPAQWTDALTLADLLADAPAVQDYLDWRGLEVDDAWDQDEPLSALCERWDIEWEELHEELLAWLEHTDESERELPEWHERLDGGEE